jgi:hypothetical protein
MAEIVNLNRYRKERAKDEKARQAAENRTKFGRAKAERDSKRHEEELRRKNLDAHRLDDTDDAG